MRLIIVFIYGLIRHHRPSHRYIIVAVERRCQPSFISHRQMRRKPPCTICHEKRSSPRRTNLKKLRVQPDPTKKAKSEGRYSSRPAWRMVLVGPLSLVFEWANEVSPSNPVPPPFPGLFRRPSTLLPSYVLVHRISARTNWKLKIDVFSGDLEELEEKRGRRGMMVLERW